MQEFRLNVSVLVLAPAACGPALPRLGASAGAAGGGGFGDARTVALAERCGR